MTFFLNMNIKILINNDLYHTTSLCTIFNSNFKNSTFKNSTSGKRLCLKK